jgi:hypothetical protein
VAVQFAAGKAEMRVDNLRLFDYHTIPNAFALGPNDPAVVSFDVVWSGPITRRVSVLDGTLGNNYAGEYVENQVTVTWSGTNLATGFSFTSNPGTFATSSVDGGFAELGHERNGIFFPPGGSGGGGSGGGGSGDDPLPPAFAVPAQQGGTLAAPPVSAALVLGGTDRGGVGSYASTAPPSASDWGTPSPARQTAQAVAPAYAALVHPGRTETRIEVLDRLFVELANAPNDGLSKF